MPPTLGCGCARGFGFWSPRFWSPRFTTPVERVCVGVKMEEKKTPSTLTTLQKS
jgi:hypothetical protein